MDDRRICQTSTATPAEPGDLLWEVSLPDRLAGSVLGVVRIGLVAMTLVLIFDRIIPLDRQPAFLRGSQLRPILLIGRPEGPQVAAAGCHGIHRSAEERPADLTGCARPWRDLVTKGIRRTQSGNVAARLVNQAATISCRFS
jgi:hypothetical protein